ncbi:hypothetical protein QTP70_003799 [Hemibagrus guttatus]|uniref:Uncharacterized protein n=1 Tax=Hemibagrus guttatus TaxID=175788 RepID=A0AAE0QTC3_9TELE|nr:hypothetical protein QTP70_003799 [Hemibagrus guttatus]
MNSCVMVITETWLDSVVPDAAIELAGRCVYQADRTADSEYLALKCRPFYAPREFTAILGTAVYIPPQANAKLALEELNEAINSQLNAYPEGAGDFNHADLKIVMPRLHTNVHFPTRENNILDQVYTNSPQAYRPAPSPHLGSSDHISIELTPSYRPLICRTQPSFKTVQVWSEESTSQLQDCFENTDWELFIQSADLEEYSSSVLAYITFCTDTVLTTKTIKVFPNQKPWLARKVRSLLKARNSQAEISAVDLGPLCKQQSPQHVEGYQSHNGLQQQRLTDQP